MNFIRVCCRKENAYHHLTCCGFVSKSLSLGHLVWCSACLQWSHRTNFMAKLKLNSSGYYQIY